ncbi:MAG: hypothetical protein RL497_1405 [Pseudomonadota bacterium]|jgi:hypothetical protein
MQNRLSLGITLLVCAIGIGLPLFWDLPGHLRLIGALQNTGHTVLFFSMAFCLVWQNFNWKIVLLALLSLGIGIEIVQYFIGKDCDVRDVVLDTLGIISGIGVFYSLKKRSVKAGIVSLLPAVLSFYLPTLIAIVYLLQWRNFPLLTNFEEPGRTHLIDYHEGSSFELVQAPRQWSSNRSTVLNLGCPAVEWPGVALIDPSSNWHGFSSLKLDVWLYGETPITLGIALRATDNNSSHHDISQRFPLQPGLNQLAWPLADVAARIPKGSKLLSKIGKIIIFCMPEASRSSFNEVAIDNLLLEPEN